MTTSAGTACPECLARMLPAERFCRRCGAESLDIRLAALRRQRTSDEWTAERCPGCPPASPRSGCRAIAFGVLTIIAAAAIGFAIVNFERARSWQDRADEWQARANTTDVRADKLEAALADATTKLAVTRIALDNANKDQTALAAQGRQCLADLSSALGAIVDYGDSPDADAALARARTSCTQFDASYTTFVTAAGR